jgi:small-conductance mechanosensitive channel
LNMPLPDNPKDLGQIEWMQFRDRARQASKHIRALTAELREARMQVLASDGQAAEAYDAQIKAEAERDALALQVQRARDDAGSAVWDEYQDSIANKWTFRKEHVENAIRRALRCATEGAGG